MRQTTYVGMEPNKCYYSFRIAHLRAFSIQNSRSRRSPTAQNQPERIHKHSLPRVWFSQNRHTNVVTSKSWFRRIHAERNVLQFRSTSTAVWKKPQEKWNSLSLALSVHLTNGILGSGSPQTAVASSVIYSKT